MNQVDYLSIKIFIEKHIELRDSEHKSGSHTPSKYWQDFNKAAGYVRRLSEKDLPYIRYHTWHLTSDNYVHYIFYPQSVPWIEHEYMNLVQSLEGFMPNESENGIGYNTKYGKISIDLLRYMRVLSDLYSQRKIQRNFGSKILEIGGGYGSLAKIFLLFNPCNTYVLCDLEETLFFQAVYLVNELGTNSVCFLTGDEPDDYRLKEGIIYLVPQFKSDCLKRHKFDIAINQQSMQEMTQEQVDNYCNLIRSTCKYFYSCNLDQHSDSLAEKNGIIKGLNDYLASRFIVEWSNKLNQEDLPGNTQTNNSLCKSGFLKWFDNLLNKSSIPMPSSNTSKTNETELGDNKIPRMILKIEV